MTAARVRHYNNLEELLRDARRLAVEVQKTLKSVDRFQRMMSLASVMRLSSDEHAARMAEQAAKAPNTVRQPAKGAAPKRPVAQPKGLPTAAPPATTVPSPAAKTSGARGTTVMQIVQRNDAVGPTGSGPGAGPDDDGYSPLQDADFHVLRTNIAQRFTAFADLRRQQIEIVNMLAQLRAEHSAEAKGIAAIQSLEALQGVIERNLTNARKLMQDLAKDKVPKNFRSLSNRIVREVERLLSKHYKTISTEFVVSPVKDEIHYVSYIHLTDFTNDHDVVSPDYYIVLTMRTLDDGGRSLHLTTLYSHQMPGLYHLGPELPINSSLNSTAVRVLEEKLHMDKFDDVLSPQPLPISGESFQGDLGLDFVDSVSLKFDQKNTIVVHMSKAAVPPKDVAARVSEVRLRIRKLVKQVHPRFNDIIRVSRVRVVGKQWVFEAFFSTNDSYTGHRMDAHDYTRLAEMFDMAPHDVYRLRQAVEKVA